MKREGSGERHRGDIGEVVSAKFSSAYELHACGYNTIAIIPSLLGPQEVIVLEPESSNRPEFYLASSYTVGSGGVVLDESFLGVAPLDVAFVLTGCVRTGEDYLPVTITSTESVDLIDAFLVGRDGRVFSITGNRILEEQETVKLLAQIDDSEVVAEKPSWLSAGT